jgi:hypothetical protein
VYTPPVGATLIRDKLANWEQFIHRHDDIDPLIRMAVAHYQFEAIHPFLDGNGRTGRVLNQALIVEQGLLDLRVLYLSRYIIRNRADYYRLLQAVTRRAAWEEWLVYLLHGVEETATWTTCKIQAIRDLLAHTATHVRDRAPNVYGHELVELIFVQPYCRIQNLVDAGVARQQIDRSIPLTAMGNGPTSDEVVSSNAGGAPDHPLPSRKRVVFRVNRGARHAHLAHHPPDRHRRSRSRRRSRVEPLVRRSAPARRAEVPGHKARAALRLDR